MEFLDKGYFGIVILKLAAKTSHSDTHNSSNSQRSIFVCVFKTFKALCTSLNYFNNCVNQLLKVMSILIISDKTFGNIVP